MSEAPTLPTIQAPALSQDEELFFSAIESFLIRWDEEHSQPTA